MGVGTAGRGGAIEEVCADDGSAATDGAPVEASPRSVATTATTRAVCVPRPARGGRRHHQRGVPLFISRSR